MSHQASTWVLEDCPNLKPHLVAVMLSLANHADHNGKNAYPSQETLAWYTRKGDRAIRDDLDALEADGLIRRGDQRVVLHLPADKRPVVYDLAMAPTDPRREPRPERRLAGRPKKDQVTADDENGRVPAPGGFQPADPTPEIGRVHSSARVYSSNREGVQIQIGGVHSSDEPSFEPSLNQNPPTPTDVGEPTPPATPDTGAQDPVPGNCGRVHGPAVACRSCRTNPRAAAKTAALAAAANRRPCPTHPQQTAGACGLCRADALAAPDNPTPPRRTPAPRAATRSRLCARCKTMRPTDALDQPCPTCHPAAVTSR